MASTLTLNLLHITFSTKDRQPLIDANLEKDLCAYIGGICRGLTSPLLEAGGMPDHLHLLVSLSKTLALSELLLNIKRDSSKWMKEVGPRAFAWQQGYFAFSIGASGVTTLTRYIEGQKEHHRKLDFKDEVRIFLRRYGLEWDERYVWE